MRPFAVLPSVLVLLAGCGLAGQRTAAYYGEGAAPTVNSISPGRQIGNLGGATATIQGAGFGADASGVVVQFGDHNAEVVSVKNDAIEIVVPPGGMGGGAARVRVGTAGGFADVPGGYEYDVALGTGTVSGAGDGVREQVGYIQVNNYWESCLGGRSDRLAAACEDISYIGYSGLDGRAELLGFAYPRLHAPSSGWWLTGGASDLAGDEWAVTRSAASAFAFGHEDLRVDMGRVRLRRPTRELPNNSACIDLDTTATYRYGGGLEGFDEASSWSDSSFPGHSNADSVAECADDEVFYDAGTLEFCARADSEGAQTLDYYADWPVKADFFGDTKRKDEVLDPVGVELDLPDLGVEGVELALPANLVVYATEGFELSGDEDGWGAFATLGHCFDEGAGGEDLDDVALRFEWEPAAKDFASEVEGNIVANRSWVRFTITAMPVGWFGPIGNSVRATITVDDRHGFDKDIDRSVVEVPSSVLYQIPSTRPPSSAVAEYAADSGYLVIGAERTVEYTVATDSGDVVFSYTTGDFGIYDWVNPTTSACHDCQDGDADGWTDDEDPDCDDGVEEIGTAGTACNNGVDDDGDAAVDAEDGGCSAATDTSE